VFEGNQWKIDDTDEQKASFLLNQLSPESLAKIRKY